MVNNSFQHPHLAAKLMVIQPHRCKVKAFQKASGSHGFTKTLGIHFFKGLKKPKARLCFRKNNYLRSFRPLEGMAHHEEGRDRWAQATVGMSPASRLLCGSPQRYPLGGKSVAREHSLMFSVPAPGSPPFRCHPHILSLETTVREEKGSRAEKGK